MPCRPLPRLVHIRTAAYPSRRCAACARRLAPADEASAGHFPLSTPECLIVIRARVCATCLAEPAVREPSGLRHLALAIARHLGDWYATRPVGSAPRSAVAAHRTLPAGARRARSRADARDSQSSGTA
jgi:hypothetical protein